MREELVAQAASLAQQVQESTARRGELATTRVDLKAVQERARDLDGRLAESRTAATAARSEADRLGAELAAVRSRAEQAEANQQQIAQSLRSLSPTEIGDDPLARAATKVEMAKGIGGDELAGANTALVEAIRGRLADDAKALAGARAAADGARTMQAQLADEAAALRAAVVDREHRIANAEAERDRSARSQQASEAEIAALRQEFSTARTALAATQDQLRLTQAEVEDLRARVDAGASYVGDEVTALKAQVVGAADERTRNESELAALREQVNGSEARSRRAREELQRALAERDRVIQEKDAQLAALAGDQADRSATEARVAALEEQLRTAHGRVRELEGSLGHKAGDAGRSGEIDRELKRVSAERDQIREQKRALESQLAEAAGSTDELRVRLDEKRKEAVQVQERLTRELTEVRAEVQRIIADKRRLNEENVGIKAKLRHLTEGK